MVGFVQPIFWEKIISTTCKKTAMAIATYSKSDYHLNSSPSSLLKVPPTPWSSPCKGTYNSCNCSKHSNVVTWQANATTQWKKHWKCEQCQPLWKQRTCWISPKIHPPRKSEFVGNLKTKVQGRWRRKDSIHYIPSRYHSWKLERTRESMSKKTWHDFSDSPMLHYLN